MRPIASFYQFSITTMKAGTTLQQSCDKYGYPVFLKVDKQLLKKLRRRDVQDTIIFRKDSSVYSVVLIHATILNSYIVHIIIDIARLLAPISYYLHTD